jgi:hypothetical protein
MPTMLRNLAFERHVEPQRAIEKFVKRLDFLLGLL